MIFSREEWANKVRDKFWYKEIPDLLRIGKDLHDSDMKAYEIFKEDVYSFFEEQLALGNVFLGDKVNIFDSERKTIDSIVIHHTSNPPQMTKERLSAMQIVRLYAPAFANPKEGDTFNRGDAVCSGHIRDGRQVFYPYHWIVREDGNAERLLLDDEIGWHSGDWDMNCRSVGIVLDGDFEKTVPRLEYLKGLTEIIRNNYARIAKECIFGHREINSKTNCPSDLFLGKDGWKGMILTELGGL